MIGPKDWRISNNNQYFNQSISCFQLSNYGLIKIVSPTKKGKIETNGLKDRRVASSWHTLRVS